MTLRQKQSKFSYMIALLILQAYHLGYEMTFADFYRSSEVKYGHKNSLHKKRLAADINLFKDGKYLTSTKSYLPIGEYWESLDPGCCWGGRFDDGNHFSFSHGGMK